MTLSICVGKTLGGVHPVRLTLEPGLVEVSLPAATLWVRDTRVPESRFRRNSSVGRRLGHWLWAVHRRGVA